MSCDLHVSLVACFCAWLRRRVPFTSYCGVLQCTRPRTRITILGHIFLDIFESERSQFVVLCDLGCANASQKPSGRKERETHLQRVRKKFCCSLLARYLASIYTTRFAGRSRLSNVGLMAANIPCANLCVYGLVAMGSGAWLTYLHCSSSSAVQSDSTARHCALTVNWLVATGMQPTYRRAPCNIDAFGKDRSCMFDNDQHPVC